MRSSNGLIWLAMVWFSFWFSEETRAYKPTRSNEHASVMHCALPWQRADHLARGTCSLASSRGSAAARNAEEPGSLTRTLGPADPPGDGMVPARVPGWAG